MAQVLGRAKIIVGSQTLRTEKGAKLSLGGIKRTAVVASSDGSFHYSEEYVEATVDCSVLNTSDFDEIALHNTTDVTINFLGDNGKKYVVGNAVSLNPPDVSDDGKIAFMFAGEAAIKQ